MEKIFLLDSGHGGMIDGMYQTAPKKMFQHENGEIAYEGVVNRLVKEKTISLFKQNNIRYVDICPTELDLSLNTRCDIANSVCDQYGNDNCLFISLHMNAGKGTGFEIYTSPGATKSDPFADLYMDQYEFYFPGHSLRKDTSDGDVDKESLFYVLVNTKCPAILPEWLFFDNYNDWVIQRDPTQQQKYAEMILNFAKRVLIKKM